MESECAPGLQDYDYMEIDAVIPNSDPNLNVTSVPEQLDLGAETTAVQLQLVAQQQPEEVVLSIIELSTVYPQTLESAAEPQSLLDDLMKDFHSSSVSVTPISMPVCSCATSSPFAGPATVTLFRPQMQMPYQYGPKTIHLLNDSFAPNKSLACSLDNAGVKKQTEPMLLRLSEPADVSTTVPSVPLFEPRSQKPEVLTPAFDLISPAESVDTGFTFGSDEDEISVTGSSCVAVDREAEIQVKADYIREVIEKRGAKPENMSSKLKVHEVIIVILLNSTHGDKTKDLQRILTFCDENGREVANECRHFKTLDTETMGLLWQKIKGNSKGNYDTFARAMRVRRERTEGFFEYLHAGKGKKKRIYRLGDRSMNEMARFKRVLRQQASRPQSCSN